MKEIQREVTTTKIETKYEAIDGTLFSTKDACIEYDNTAAAVINAAFNKVPGGNKRVDECRLFFDSYDSPMYILRPRNEEDIKAINMFCKYHACNSCSSEFVDNSYIGKTIVITFNYEMDWFTINGTIDEIIDAMKTNFVKIESEVFNDDETENNK